MTVAALGVAAEDLGHAGTEALEQARAGERVASGEETPIGEGVTDPGTVGPAWRLWLDVRDAIEPGHSWRFSEAQCEYHYSHDYTFLEKCVAELSL
jgi:hypothetical protein